MSVLRRLAAPTLLPAMLFLALTACASKATPEAKAGDAASAPMPTATLASAAAPAAAPAGAPPAGAPPAPGAVASDVSGAVATPPPPPATSEFDKGFLSGGESKKTASGVQYADLAPGTGAEIGPGAIGVLEFTGWLGDGKEFDSSKQRPGQFCFSVGAPRSISFFNEGLAGMKAGGMRRLRIPPENGYGSQGRPPIIPPNSTLLFEVKLLEVRSAAVKPDLAKLSLKTTPSGLKWADVAVGKGDEVVDGSTAITNYSGFLEDGTKFDSSLDRCQTFTVKNVGKAPVIDGWNEGLKGMKVGGRRVLVIPPELAYGPSGRPPVIPMNATLIFDMEMVEVAAPPKAPEPMNFPDLATLKLTSNPSGLKWADIRVGSGKEVVKGSSAAMHYTGWLDSGSKFDSSVDRGETFDVANVGNAGVIAGWNEGLQGMKEGGRRVLVIPASLGYGERGFPPVIPAGATLVFMIDAVKVTP